MYPDSTFVVITEGLHAPAESQGTLYSNACAAGLVTNFIETLEVGDTSCAQSPEIIFSSVGRFPLVAADARPAEVDRHGNNQIGVAERKAVTVAVAAAIDALKRSTVGLGNGVGLRAGTFQTTYDGKGGQTTTLTNCAFATDVTVSGTFVWGADKSFVADLTVSGTGAAGGTLHVEGTWQAPGRVGKFKVSGTLGNRNVGVLVPEA